MLEDYWAHRVAEDPNAAREEFEDDDFDLERAVQAINDGTDEWVEVASGRYQDPR